MNFRFLPALALATGCISKAPLIETSFAPVPASGHVRVNVAADDASVRVVAADVTAVEMRAESRGYDVDRDLDLGITPRGDQVDITAKIRGDFHFELTEHSLHIEIRVPRDADLEVSTGDGDVELEALAGTVDVGTGDGAVTLRGGRGGIRLHTGDGSVTGSGLDGSVEISTGDGKVDVAGRFDLLIASTGDGELTASAAAGSRMTQPWHLESQDGDVTLGVPRDLAAHIDASSTGDGRVRSSIPLSLVDPSRAVGDVNGGGPSIILRTGDGSIQLDQL